MPNLPCSGDRFATLINREPLSPSKRAPPREEKCLDVYWAAVLCTADYLAHYDIDALCCDGEVRMSIVGTLGKLASEDLTECASA